MCAKDEIALINEDNNNNFCADNGLIFGRNPVIEALRSGREIDKLYISSGGAGGTVKAIIAKCRERKIPIKEVPAQKLDFMCGKGNHQGVAISVCEYGYSSVDDLLKVAEERGEKPFIVICDGIEDPHNLGAIIRTVECCGAHGVIIPERRSASLSPAVTRSASGALEYVKVARVTNLVSAIEKLKEAGLWIYAADMDGECWCGTDLNCSIGIVIGSEGAGVGRLVKEKCDAVLSLPMKGKINSLNASVAAGVILYEAARQRGGISAFSENS